jgi:hypothetical protein
MSRANDWLNWNYTPNDPDGNEAFAANLDRDGPGLLPEDLIAFHPWTEDTAFFASRDRIWRLVGDPADGGIMDEQSVVSGCVSPLGVATDDKGHLYYVGYRGLYVWPRGSGVPLLLSDGRQDEFFDEVNLEEDDYVLEWNTSMQGLHIFVVPKNHSGEARKHLWWDASAKAFFPDRFPARCGPSSSATILIPSEQQQRYIVLMGGRDGHIYRQKFDADDDAGDLIDAVCTIGPFTADAFGSAQLNWFDLKFAAATDEAAFEMIRAQNAYDLIDSDPVAEGKLLTSRAAHRIVRSVRGGAVGVRLRSVENPKPKVFAIEAMMAGVDRAETIVRRRR